MERDANYFLVGLISLILLVLAGVFVTWLARVQFTQDYAVYDISFVGPVRGLSEGGEVHFNGIKVGEVTKISLDPKDSKRVIARARITSDVPIRTDSYATLEPQGITGVNYVQIASGTATKPLLRDAAERGTVPVIMSQQGPLADLLEGGGTVLTRTLETINRVNQVMSDENIKSLGRTFKNIEVVTAEARDRMTVIEEAETTLKNIDRAAQSFESLSKTSEAFVNGDASKSMADVSAAAEELRTATEEARVLIAQLKEPTAEFTKTGLPRLSSAISTLQAAAESLDRLATEAEVNPRGLLSKAPAKELEVRP
jgi:phospholipid/cholesterol/gamma-HCH transport system substrate-binding protein